MANHWIKNNHTSTAELLYNSCCVVYEWTYNLLRVSVTYLLIPASCRAPRDARECQPWSVLAAHPLPLNHLILRTRAYRVQTADRCVQTSARFPLVLFIVHRKHCEEMILPTFVLFADLRSRLRTAVATNWWTLFYLFSLQTHPSPTNYKKTIVGNGIGVNKTAKKGLRSYMKIQVGKRKLIYSENTISAFS